MKDIASQRDPRQARPNGQDWQPRSGPKPCSPSRVSPGTDDARPLSFNSPTTPRCVSECGGSSSRSLRPPVSQPVSVSFGFISGAQVRICVVGFFMCFFFPLFKSIYNFPVAILGSA